jgi:hypothetical protein
MWIDPGEVAVKIAWGYSQVVKEEVIYSVNRSGCYPRIIITPATPPPIPKLSFQGTTMLGSRVNDSSLLGIPSNHSQDKHVPYEIQQVWMGSEGNVVTV